jgi:hypothetical protein
MTSRPVLPWQLAPLLCGLVLLGACSGRSGSGDAGADADGGTQIDGPIVPCGERSPDTCLDQPGCALVGCQDCDGVLQRSCVERGAVTVCPPLTCPGCDGKDEADCQEAPGCHAVYDSPGPPAGPDCTCEQEGCCEVPFLACRGGPPICEATVTCKDTRPECYTPLIVGLSDDGCYEGCVLASQCP